VANSIKSGADVVTFSGDKLLGGPQAGIIAGRAEYVAKIKKHPFARAVRIDKLSLAALEATLQLYFNPQEAATKIPTLYMLNASPDELQKKAERLAAMLNCTIISIMGQAGGGAMPEEELPSWAVAPSCGGKTAEELERHFRTGEVPVIGRINRGQFLLDVRTVEEGDFPVIAERFALLINREVQPCVP
jgi:L-seryl-tRNA(Ser) seleniumtransferase